MPGGDAYQLILLTGLLVIYLVAFALPAAIAALAGVSWRISGSIGIAVVAIIIAVHFSRGAIPMALGPALGLLAVVGLTALWRPKP